jgi:hypothetical protein
MREENEDIKPILTTCWSENRTLQLKEVDLFIMVKETEVVFPQYKGSTCCGWREPENITHFPPFLLCNNLQIFLSLSVENLIMHHSKIEGLDIRANLLITTPFCNLYIKNMQI